MAWEDREEVTSTRAVAPASRARAPIAFAVVSEAPGAEAHLAKIGEALSRETFCPVTPRVVRTFAELSALMRRGQVQAAWTPPLVAVELERLGIGAIALGLWRGGTASYSSALFVRGASPVHELAGLRGKRIAWVDRESAAGYVFPRMKLIAAGLHPDATFASQTFYRTHEEVARAVLDGRADVGATCVTFRPGTAAINSAGWLKAGVPTPEGGVRILALAGPIPPDAIVLSRAVDEPTRRRFADGLLRLSVTYPLRDAFRTLFAGDGFVHANANQYEPLRKLLDQRPSMRINLVPPDTSAAR